MERIGIYGGTFNPPHVGHVRGAQYALEALGLSCLYVIPSFVPPHKTLSEDTPTPRQRLEMVQLAFADSDKIQVSDLELCRGGTSYTVDTVLQLRKQHPEEELVLVLGSDMLLAFEKWYRWQDILQMASLAVFYRGDPDEEEKILAQKTKLEQSGATVYLVENPVTAICSTQLRRLMTFRCAQEFLPPAVYRYIQDNNLYGWDKDYRCLPMEKLEKAVISLLKANRVAHVLGCRQASEALAARWGADRTDAARAGLLHDITKALDGPLQLTLCRAYGVELDNFSTQNPKTLHALTGSLVAERIFGENQAVVAAICSHTTGKADMNLLEKIIYVADYMEPNRDFPGVDDMRRLADSNIDQALKMGLEMTLAMLKLQGRDISPASSQALAWLEANT